MFTGGEYAERLRAEACAAVFGPSRIVLAKGEQSHAGIVGGWPSGFVRRTRTRRL